MIYDVKVNLLCYFHCQISKYICTIMILSFWTDMLGQTVQTQIRLLLRSSLIKVYTVCHSVCIFWTQYSMVESQSSNFRVITANFLGVRIFRKFTVHAKTMYRPVFPILWRNVPRSRIKSQFLSSRRRKTVSLTWMRHYKS